MLRQVTFASLMLGLFGCAGLIIGDDVMKVKGRLALSDTSSEKCNLSLTRIEEKTASAYNTRRIGIEYSEDFTIAPGVVTDYRITIACPGYESIERIVRSKMGLTDVDLGTLTPKRMQ